jgi:hypothetical protein
MEDQKWLEDISKEIYGFEEDISPDQDPGDIATQIIDQVEKEMAPDMKAFSKKGWTIINKKAASIGKNSKDIGRIIKEVKKIISSKRDTFAEILAE